ncbi:unnamed protein product [Rhizoctonia solani]|uniref:Uncharacterized protein n=1 Tax=Rhizoctonia solani TaxID=456999 RepID=A0A8H2ZU76_9AGAM|nr:unnamed protein product [Rhizoctonia solani]
MDDTTLGINAAGNSQLFDNDFLRMLQKPLATTTLVDPTGNITDIPSDDPPQIPSAEDRTESVPFDAELMGLTGSASALSFIECMRNAFESQTENVREQWQQAAEKLMEEVIHTTSPKVVDRRERINKLYRTYVFHQDKRLPQEKQWEQATFEKYWTNFLIALITCSRGRDGGRIKVDTFKQWCSDLIWLIGRNMINSEGKRVGTKVLTSGLYAQFRNITSRFCVQFKLSREPPTRLWIGYLELLLVYQAAIRLSEKYGRASILQTILATSMVFQIGARIGSLGWSHTQYRDEEKFMKRKDVVIERMDYGVWDAEVTVMNQKVLRTLLGKISTDDNSQGWNDTQNAARPLKYRVSAVTKTHMLWFDTPSLLLLHLMRMGALKDCRSISDIFNYNGRFFVIEEEFREKPLYLERTEQGLGLVKDKAASANGMTASFQVLGKAAGFEVTNYHALRRDSATVVSVNLEILCSLDQHIPVWASCRGPGWAALPGPPGSRLGIHQQLHQGDVTPTCHGDSTRAPGSRVTSAYAMLTCYQIGLQRHRREGLAANVLLNAGFRIKVPAQELAQITGEPVEESDPQVEEETDKVMALESTMKLSNFGEGLLSDQCRSILSSASLIGDLKAAEANEENEQDDYLIDDDAEDDEVIPPKFQDVDDLKILDADLVETKKEWMKRLLEPLIVEDFYEQLSKEHDGKYPCLACKALPEDLKPRTHIGNKICQDIFPTRVGLERHQDLIHTTWFDLVQYMITKDPKVFICPTQECTFRDDNVQSVRFHCLKDCKERESYKRIQQRHEELLEKRRQETPSRERLKQEKQMRELMGPGILLAENIFEGTKKISNTSPEEALQLAKTRRIEEPRVTPHLNAIAALNERMRTAIDEEGVIRDPYANRTMESVSRELLTYELNADIDRRLEEKASKK